MKHSDVKLNALKSYDDCDSAIESIEADCVNYHGGLARWNTGRETILLDAAQKKIDRILDRQTRSFPLCDCCGEEITPRQVDNDGCGLCRPCGGLQIYA